MIHSFRHGREVKLQLLRVPCGTYAVLHAYVWEKTAPETIRIWLNVGLVERDDYNGLTDR